MKNSFVRIVSVDDEWTRVENEITYLEKVQKIIVVVMSIGIF